MFDIGFWELIVIAVIALLVVGPEQLPGFVREKQGTLPNQLFGPNWT